MRYMVIGTIMGAFIVILALVFIVGYGESKAKRCKRAIEAHIEAQQKRCWEKDPDGILVLVSDGCLTWSEGLYSDYKEASLKMASIMETDPAAMVYLLPVEDKR
jgi:hypothetical protein